MVLRVVRAVRTIAGRWTMASPIASISLPSLLSIALPQFWAPHASCVRLHGSAVCRASCESLSPADARCGSRCQGRDAVIPEAFQSRF